uniref:Uncharacterized protein n=1 Tax=Meloidogyne incognita TaxID=6306 RepID=A0A914LK60_MELIC
MNLEFGESLICYVERDFTDKNGFHSTVDLNKCDTEKWPLSLFGHKCAKKDCGDNGYVRGCGSCKAIRAIDTIGGYGDYCTCHECDTDFCNSAIGILSDMKIILLFWFIIILINAFR